MGAKARVKERALTYKQDRFCVEYLIDLNGSAACRRAGYTGKHLDVMASNLLSHPSIIKRIGELKAALEKKYELTVDKVILELVSLGFWNIQDFLNEDNTIKKLHEVPKEKAKAVVGIKVKETFVTKDIKEVTTELKLVDKRGALVDLGRHLGIFEKDDKQKTESVITKFMTLTESLKAKNQE